MADTQLNETREWNERFCDSISSNDPQMQKKATDAASDYTRVKMREEGFTRKIMPPIQVTNSDLTRQHDTDKLVKIVDKEPLSPGAKSINFGDTPDGWYIRAPRYRVFFDYIVSTRFVKNVDELRTYEMDIRQILSDNSLKEVQFEEDKKFITAVDAVVGSPGVPTTFLGAIQNEAIPGGIDRDSLEDSFKTLPRLFSRLEVNTVLVNNITIREIMKFGRDEMGGNYSEDLLRNGKFEMRFMNADWWITNKLELVAENHMYHFAHPKFIGKNYVMEDVSMYVKREWVMVEFFLSELVGGAIGNVGGCSKATFGS